MKSRHLLIITMLAVAAAFLIGRKRTAEDAVLAESEFEKEAPGVKISRPPATTDVLEGISNPLSIETGDGLEAATKEKALPEAVEIEEVAIPEGRSVLYDVPFTPQAPFARWDDLRQQDGCEEASILMAVHWFLGKELTPAIAEREIIGAAGYQWKNYGSYRDTSAEDTVERIAKGYFGYESAEYRRISGTEDIIEELLKGNLVAVPVNGQKLKNPHYTPPGAQRHFVLVVGYDAIAEEFVTNDPGTRRGEKYRYSRSVLGEALRDYPTGNHEPITTTEKYMAVIGPEGKE